MSLLGRGPAASESDLAVVIAPGRPLAINIDDMRHFCPANCLVIRQATAIELASTRDDGCFWLMIVAEPVLRSLLPTLPAFYDQPFGFERGAGAMLVDMLAVILRHADSVSAASRQVVVDQLCSLLVSIVSDGRRQTRALSSFVRESHIERIRAYIVENLMNPDLGIEEIARGCGISKRYLHDLFRETGTSVGAWVRQQRLSRAKSQLTDPYDNRPISCVAYDLGFASQAQFSRSFKACFGVAPSDYRRQMRVASGIGSESPNPVANELEISV